MKIRVLLNLGTNEFGADALTEGIHEVAEPLAQNLIGRKLAVRVDDEPKVVSMKAVAAQGATVAESQPVAVKSDPKPVASKRSAEKHSHKDS